MKEYQKDMMKAFARAAAKQEDMSSNDFIDAILAERPDLKGQMVYVPRQGIYGHTVFIGDEVFKGPNAKGNEQSFDTECRVLQTLEGKGLLAPRVTCVGKKNVFFGMARVRGVTLYSVMNELSEDERRVLTKDVVDFVIGMANALPMRDGKYAYHNDMHANNVLVDPETKRLAGVIDFGLIWYSSADELGRRVRLSYYLRPYLEQEYKSRKGELSAPVPPVSQARGLSACC